MSEKELIEKSLEGDDAAFSKLFESCHDRIFHHCLGVVKEEEAAKDLVQETFLHAYRHLEQFRGAATFYTWVYRIAHNLSLNYLKKKGRYREEEFNEEIMSPVLQHHEEIRSDLTDALKTLSEEHRMVYEMCELEGRSQKEVALILHIPEGTVRSRLHYARKGLHTYFFKTTLDQ